MKRVFAGAALMLPVLASAGNLELTMNRTVAAGHSYVTVEEIAIIHGAADDVEKVRRLRLQLHGRPGVVVRVSRKRVASLITASGHRGRMDWQGPAFAEVQVGSQTVGTGMLVEAAVSYLTELARRDGMPVSIKAAREPSALKVPAGVLEIRPRRATTAWRARTRVEVDLWVDGSRIASVPVYVDVRRPGKAMVATHDIGREKLLSRDDARLGEVDLLPVKGTPVLVAERLDGMRLRRGLREGEVICESDLERRPEVMKGEIVRGQLTMAAITLEVEGVAAEEGRLGEQIRVLRGSDSSAWFYGVVTGEGAVAVYE